MKRSTYICGAVLLAVCLCAGSVWLYTSLPTADNNNAGHTTELTVGTTSSTSIPATQPPTPTSVPASEPTNAPAATPTPKPTGAPTLTPTPEPTGAPTLTPMPEPTSVPTSSPTPEPTSMPTSSPTPELTSMPTSSPTPEPTTETSGPLSPKVSPAPAPLNLEADSVTLLVNREYPLPADHKPDDLVVPDVAFTFAYYDDKKLMRKEAAEALKTLFAAGEEEDIILLGVSAFRSYDRQYTIYATNLITRGVRHTNQYSAAPGASEHQTGLAIDVTSKSAGYQLIDQFGSTPEGIWLSENAHRFGFIIRYQKGNEAITGYAYEPWHIRYVGVDLATYLYENNLTLEEYYGAKPNISFQDLADTPLIDTESDRYKKIYDSLVKPPEPETTEPPKSENTTQPEKSSENQATHKTEESPETQTTTQPEESPETQTTTKPEESSAPQTPETGGTT